MKKARLRCSTARPNTACSVSLSTSSASVSLSIPPAASVSAMPLHRGGAAPAVLPRTVRAAHDTSSMPIRTRTAQRPPRSRARHARGSAAATARPCPAPDGAQPRRSSRAVQTRAAVAARSSRWSLRAQPCWTRGACTHARSHRWRYATRQRPPWRAAPKALGSGAATGLPPFRSRRVTPSQRHPGSPGAGRRPAQSDSCASPAQAA